MDATVSPWSTLQHLFQRWQWTAAARTAPTRFADNLFAFLRKHRMLATGLGAALSAVLGAYCMYKFVAGDVPALRNEYQKVAGETYGYRSDVASIRSQLDRHVTEEKASREGMTNALRAIDANLLVLGQKIDGRPLALHEARTVLATVRAVSLTEAAKLESIATIGGVIPDEYTPMLALAKKEDSLREFATFFGAAATPSVQPAYLGKLLLTRNGTWYVLDRQILFKWDGGSARLRPTSDLPQSEIVRKAELFNSVSRAVTHAAGIAPTIVTPPSKAAPKANAAPRANSVPSAQRRPQPPRRVEVVKRPEPAPIRRPAGVATY